MLPHFSLLKTFSEAYKILKMRRKKVTKFENRILKTFWTSLGFFAFHAINTNPSVLLSCAQTIYIYIFLWVYLPLWLSDCLTACLSVCLSVWLSVCCISVYLSDFQVSLPLINHCGRRSNSLINRHNALREKPCPSTVALKRSNSSSKRSILFLNIAFSCLCSELTCSITRAVSDDATIKAFTSATNFSCLL